jgi:hypothetical protein
MVKARRVVATGIAFATALSLAACSTGTVQVGQRPHQPTGTSAPSASTGQPSAIRLSSLPNWTEPTKSGATYTRPFTDSEGTFSWSVVDANGIAISYTPREQVVFGEADQYNQVPGVLTFRGNNHRTGGTYGTPTVTQEQLSVAVDQAHRRDPRRGLVLAGRRLDGTAAAGAVAARDEGRDGSGRQVRQRRQLRRGHLSRLRGQDLPARPGHRRGDQTADRGGLGLQGHRVHRPARLPAAVRRSGPQRHQRHLRPVALPGVRPHPEQGGLAHLRARSGSAAPRVGGVRLLCLDRRRDRHPDRAGRERADLQGEAQQRPTTRPPRPFRSTRRSPGCATPRPATSATASRTPRSPIAT